MTEFSVVEKKDFILISLQSDMMANVIENSRSARVQAFFFLDESMLMLLEHGLWRISHKKQGDVMFLKENQNESVEDNLFMLIAWDVFHEFHFRRRFIYEKTDFSRDATITNTSMVKGKSFKSQTSIQNLWYQIVNKSELLSEALVFFCGV